MKLRWMKNPGISKRSLKRIAMTHIIKTLSCVIAKKKKFLLPMKTNPSYQDQKWFGHKETRISLRKDSK
jgi:hypothetical protein